MIKKDKKRRLSFASSLLICTFALIKKLSARSVIYLCRMNITVSNNIYQQAQVYARQQGLDLNHVVEVFLSRFVRNNKTAAEQEVPDVVLSLLGAGMPIADDDLNGRKAYQQYLEEKHL